MNNINTIDENKKSKPNWLEKLGCVLMLAGLLNASSPSYAQTSNYNSISTEQVTPQTSNYNSISTEQVTPQTNKLNGIKLPTIYQNKLDDFLANNDVMKDEGTKAFTINFVEKEKEADRGISKENQLLFIRHAIYKQVTGNDLYDGQDGNQKIAEDFNNKTVNIRIKAGGQKYRNWALAYMNQRSAEARQQSTEAKQQSAEARQQSAEIKKNIMQKDTLGLKEMAKFYSLYTKKTNNVKPEEIERSKELLQRVIPDCKKYGIDYRAILLEEVGDKEKVDKILEFYGIKDPDIAQIKSDYNIVSHYNPAQDASSEVKDQWYEQREINAKNELKQVKLAHDIAENMMNNYDNNLGKLAA